MTSDLKARLDAMARELKEFDAKATPAPWITQEEDEHGTEMSLMGPMGSDDFDQLTLCYTMSSANAELLKTLRNAVPDILSALSKLDAAEANNANKDRRIAELEAKILVNEHPEISEGIVYMTLAEEKMSLQRDELQKRLAVTMSDYRDLDFAHQALHGDLSELQIKLDTAEAQVESLKLETKALEAKLLSLTAEREESDYALIAFRNFFWKHAPEGVECSARLSAAYESAQARAALKLGGE